MDKTTCQDEWPDNEVRYEKQKDGTYKEICEGKIKIIECVCGKNCLDRED